MHNLSLLSVSVRSLIALAFTMGSTSRITKIDRISRTGKVIQFLFSAVSSYNLDEYPGEVSDH